MNRVLICALIIWYWSKQFIVESYTKSTVLSGLKDRKRTKFKEPFKNNIFRQTSIQQELETEQRFAFQCSSEKSSYTNM